MILANAVLPCAMAQSVAAAEVKIGGRPLAFETLSGDCLFDKTQLEEEKIISAMRRIALPTEIMVWAYMDCAQKEQLNRQPKTAVLERVGSVSVTKREAVFRAAGTMTRAAFVAEMARTQPWHAMFKDALQRTTAATGIPMKQHMVKVVAKDETAIYIATTGSMLIGQMRSTYTGITAMTTINSLPVILDLSIPSNQMSTSDLLKQQKAYIRALIDRNEQDAPSSPSDG